MAANANNPNLQQPNMETFNAGVAGLTDSFIHIAEEVQTCARHQQTVANEMILFGNVGIAALQAQIAQLGVNMNAGFAETRITLHNIDAKMSNGKINSIGLPLIQLQSLDRTADAPFAFGQPITDIPALAGSVGELPVGQCRRILRALNCAVPNQAEANAVQMSLASLLKVHVKIAIGLSGI